MTIMEKDTELKEFDLMSDSDEIPAEIESVTVRLVNITPELAKEWLTRNTHNRKAKPTTIDLISRAILLGEWEFNGESIKFDVNNVLLDGQNRLHAIQATGESVYALVVEGLPAESQMSMDRGARRSLADILELLGEKTSVALASTLALIHITERGANRNQTVNRPTDGQAVKLLGDHPEIKNAVKNAYRVRNHLPLSVTIIATCWYFFSTIDENDNRDFWSAVSTGFHLPLDGEEAKAAAPGSGPYLLKRYLERERGRREVPQFVKHAIVIKAWNMYRSGATGQHISFRPGGQRPEVWPEPI